MAAEDDSKSSTSRSRFKSKWGKILKHSDDIKSLGDSLTSSSGSTKKSGKAAKQQEDVDDFLKPSVERAAANRPRLDVSLAQRWPGAGVESAGAGGPPDAAMNVNGWRKRRRREGLTVGFVKTVPETIGHGGDETMDPPRDVGDRRRKEEGVAAFAAAGGVGLGVGVGRQEGGAQDARIQQQQQQATSANAAVSGRSLEGARIPTNQAPQPQNGWFSVEEPPPPPRIGISRAPTGFSPEPDDFSPVSEPGDAPSLPTILAPPQSSEPGQLKVSPTPSSDPNSLTTRKRHDMVKNEGMALRRASAMIEPIDLEDDSELDLGLYAAATATYRAEAAATPPVVDADRQPTLPNVDPPSPQSDGSLDSPSPFADERYIKRHSKDAPMAPPHTQYEPAPAPAPPPQGGRSPFADPKYLRSRSRDASPARLRRQDGGVDQAGQGRAVEQPALDFSRQYLDPQTDVHPAAETAPRLERPQNADMSFIVPQGPRQAPPSQRTPSPTQKNSSRSSTHQPLQALEQPLHMEEPGYENTAPAPAYTTRPLPAPQLLADQEDKHSSGRDRSPLRSRIFDSSSTTSHKPPSLMPRPNASNTSVNMFAPASGSHSRHNSYDHKSSSSIERPSDSAGPLPPLHGFDASSRTTSPPSSLDAVPGPPHVNAHLSGARSQPVRNDSSTTSSQLAVPNPSPYARRPSANDYFNVDRQEGAQPARSPMSNTLQPGDTARPGSGHSSHSFLRPSPPSHTPSATDLAAQGAFDDFTSRVAHMKGVFRLTAEKEQPSDTCTPFMWLRAAFWWFLRGKIGLEGLVQQRAKAPEAEHRELLLQPHVDLAKTSWILSDPLDGYDGDFASRGDSDEALLSRDLRALKEQLKTLSQSMQRNHLMPPPQSLIQGQDTQIWLEYPNFAPDATAALRGIGAKDMDVAMPAVSPLEALPLADTSDYHYFTRFTVNVSLNTDDVSTDRVSVPCNLTILRGKRDYQSTVVIASQSELVHVKIAPKHSNASNIAWQNVSWKASSLAISVGLPQGIDMTVRFFEQDFRKLWNLVEHSRRVDYSLRAEKNETLLHETQLVEVQYVDSSNSKAFPQDKVKRCRALLWERWEESRDGGGVRKKHRGFRLAVVTDSAQKGLTSFSHEICVNDPLFFEFITDAAAQGTTAMVIRIREQSRECRMLLVFQDMDSRQALYNKLNGIDVRSDETIVGKMALASLNIESVTEFLSGSSLSPSHSELSTLQWQRLGVTNHITEDTRPSTIDSSSLRLIARHTYGCITDRLNLARGELLLRLPCLPTPSIQILRPPQPDLTTSLDARATPPPLASALTDLHTLAQTTPTIRTLTFPTPADLHAFQTALTGLTVRYDGLASSLAISRRRMVVPIYHKWTASNARVQVLSNLQGSVHQIVAFMEGFAHADRLCLQVRETDVFEASKGGVSFGGGSGEGGKGKRWTVKVVDAKFSLPSQGGKEGRDGAEGGLQGDDERVKRRFVNLEGLEYAAEHDDVTLGFESEDGMFFCFSFSFFVVRFFGDCSVWMFGLQKS